MLLGIVQFYSETNFKEMKLIQAAGKHATTSTLAQKQHSMSTLSPSPARLTYKPNPKSVGTVKQASIGTVKHAKIHGAASPSALRSKGNLKKPRSIFDNIKRAMLKELSLHKHATKHRLQKKAEVDPVDNDSGDEEAMEKDDEDPNPETNFDPVRSTVYVYAGREVKPQGTEVAAYILQSGLGVEKVGYINSASDSDVRSALWDEDCKVNAHCEQWGLSVLGAMDWDHRGVQMRTWRFNATAQDGAQALHCRCAAATQRAPWGVPIAPARHHTQPNSCLRACMHAHLEGLRR